MSIQSLIDKQSPDTTEEQHSYESSNIGDEHEDLKDSLKLLIERKNPMADAAERALDIL